MGHVCHGVGCALCAAAIFVKIFEEPAMPSTDPTTRIAAYEMPALALDDEPASPLAPDWLARTATPQVSGTPAQPFVDSTSSPLRKPTWNRAVAIAPASAWLGTTFTPPVAGAISTLGWA